ncbi:DUF221 domain-containing protein [Coniochaeta ligniaria NRRL 30616]|uniref:DUF221 domain-containing protein n=1 Tax=Coniochaeta ligniaria NRRL 30616 TaxID=1408157 RepID=A0A1J7INQ6_9PEZI|nr:DUF221 domain-containing protein [Coniochaeta ligniaria NRRL 30616]
MATTDWALGHLDVVVGRQLINQSDDPRVGSGRNGSDGGTLSHLSSGSDSASLSSLGGTFVPVVVYSAVCLILFLFLRTRCPRVYAARTIPGILLPHELSPPLPSGWFNWIIPLIKTPDATVLRHCSLDGFFFLRYLKVLSVICFVGLCLTWPILLPLHGTGGSGLKELDLLTIGNVLRDSKFYAHVVVSWCFFGFVMFMISRECIYYINLRQAYLLSPSHAHRLSSRTVLFTCVPQALLDERKIRKLFGDSVRNVWIPRNTKALASVVKEREQTAMRLEKAEIALIKKANAARNKSLGIKKEVMVHGQPRVASRKSSKSSSTRRNVSVDIATKRVEEPEVVESGGPFSHPDPSDSPLFEEEDKVEDPDYIHPYGLDPSLPDVRGSVAAQWIPVEARPTHRPLANYGRQVDTIRWTRLKLKEFSIKIYKLRRDLKSGIGAPICSVFVEFDSQASAQAGYQILVHHRPLHMSPGYIGIRPNDVIWSTLRMPWWERIMRRFLFMGVITAAIIFWSIPSAFVGLVSNVKFLSKNVPFLAWVVQMPKAILGVIEGLLPALALSMLMAAVPGMLRACARASGVPSRPLIELFTQGWYFIFQVVQVFLITTLTSAASAAFKQILEDPLSAKDLLAQNLPKASNFYLSYILVQCLAGGSLELLRAFDLLRHQFFAKNIESPRKKFKIWHELKQRHWGGIFPVFTNMGVIAICYSCIAPLILVFAGLGMTFIYFVYKYNLIYSYDADIDTKGLLYPKALMQLFVGLYMSEICLIGLFALHTAFVPLVLMILFAVFTAMIHISLSDALGPLLNNLPRTLALQDQSLAEDSIPNDNINTVNNDGIPPEVQGGTASDYYNMEEGFGMDTDPNGAAPGTTGGTANDYYNTEEDFGMDPTPHPAPTTRDTDRGIEGAGGFMSSLGKFAWLTTSTKLNTQADESGLTLFLARVKARITPDINKKPNFLIKFFHPEVYQDYHILKEMMPPGPPPEAAELPEQYARRGYFPPEMWMPAPKLWIPRDEARVSRQEVAHTRESVPISDRGAWLDERGRIEVDVNMAPFKEYRVLY